MKQFTRSLIAVLFFCFSFACWAWNYTGHMVVANIAYSQMTPQARQRADQLIRLMQKYYPDSKTFIQSSVWADQIKANGVTAFNRWHYANKPLHRGVKIETVPEHKQNVVWAIQQSRKVLHSDKSNDFEKAFFLRMLIHLVADIHQPLHCVSLYSEQYPKGDAGGNLYTVQSGYGDNLHAVWDNGVGYFRRYTGKNRINSMAKAITKDYPPLHLRQQINRLRPQQWLDESAQIANDFVYQALSDQRLSREYLQQGRDIVELQLALAGYRLATILNSELK